MSRTARVASLAATLALAGCFNAQPVAWPDAGVEEADAAKPPRPENEPATCSDGVDNDKDGLADCNDTDCWVFGFCARDDAGDPTPTDGGEPIDGGEPGDAGEPTDAGEPADGGDVPDGGVAECVREPQDLAQFGIVATGTSQTLEVSVSNPSATTELTVTVDAIAGVDANGFRMGAFPPGVYPIAPGGTLRIPIAFAPMRAGPHSAYVAIRAPECPAVPLQLAGVGVEQVLLVEPDTLDFGYVSPPAQATYPVTFRNLGGRDISVTALNVTNASPTAPFELIPVTGAVVVPAAGTANVQVAFKPTLLGAHLGQLTFTSNDLKRPNGAVWLRGVGGGPDIEPGSPIDFGPAAVGTLQYRSVTIANVGTDVPATEDDSLRFVQRDPAGVWQAKPPEIAGTNADQFQLEWPPRGLPASGLAAGKSVAVNVKFVPTQPGTASAVLRIHSNDPDEPVADVALQGNAMSMPRCDYEVVPASLAFGTIDKGRQRQMSFYVRNLATNPADQCLITMPGIAAGASPAFSLVNGPLSGTMLAGGQTLEIPVRFAPTTVGAHAGFIDLFVSSTARPEARVLLTGAAEDQACLLVAPNDLDFGVAQVNCTSRERTFTVYNLCATSVSVMTIELVPGGSTDFRITARPVLPKSLMPGQSLEFKAAYRPLDIGTDTGAIAIAANHLPLPYVAEIAGTGAVAPIQTDTIVIDPQPKVDVLVIVDNSGSMGTKQAMLAANFDSFIMTAVRNRVDYHIAVTTTGVDLAHGGGGNNVSPPDENGRFLPLSGANPKVITSATPNLSQVWRQNVQVGTSGNTNEMLIRPAYLALSNPLVTGHNAGFLRDEASLAVVVVSDAADTDNQSIAFYQDFLTNLKGLRNQNQISVSGIIPTQLQASGGCTYDSQTAGQSARFRDLVQRTGGVFDEICTPDWPKTVEKMGATAFKNRTRFFLSNVPDLTTAIVVKVDGIPFAEIGPFGDRRWTYNSTANCIDFEPINTPDPGSTLSFTYQVACLP